MADCEESSSSSWRFSMELLSHVHTLRVFLFNSSLQVNPHQDCVCLEATLLSAPPTLSCTWKTAHHPSLYSLRLPLPLLLFDYFAAPRISSLPNCIQLSLSLLALPPSHLHAFSSLSLAHDDILTHKSDGMCAHNTTDIPGVHREAFRADNDLHGDDDNSYCIGGVQNHTHDDIQEVGHVATRTSYIRSCCHHDGVCEADHNATNVDDNITKNALHAAHDVGHFGNDAHQSHEHDHTSAIGNLGSLVDNSIHGSHHACAQEHAVYAHNNYCSLEQPTQGSYHKGDVEAHDTHEVRQDAATASNFPGCHKYGMSKACVDNCIHGESNGVNVDDNACKSHEHDDTDGVQQDISGCHHNGMSEVDHDKVEAGEDFCKVSLHALHAHDNICCRAPPTHASSTCFQHLNDGIEAHNHPTRLSGCSSSHDEDVAFEGSLQCEHGRNMVDLSKDGSSLHSQQHDCTILDSLSHQGHEDQTSQGSAIFCCKKCLVKVSRNPLRNLVQLPCFDWRDIVENWFGACCCSFGSKAEILSASFEKSLQLRPGRCLVGPSTFYVDFSDVTVETESVVPNRDSEIRHWRTLHFLALGNGFIVWENQQSKYFSWQPVYCTGCASLIGAYPCKPTDTGLIREGLHLFRCRITVFNADGSLYDMFRCAAYKELLAKELRLRTEENTSYRFLIRSLSTQLPLLQLVVLSYDSLICTGNVTAYMLDIGNHPQSTSETTNLVGEVGLQQCIKVLFLDCSGFSGNEIRSIESWVQDYDAETIFMLEEFVDILKRELMSNRMFYPAACGLSQVFHGSFIRTLQE